MGKGTSCWAASCVRCLGSLLATAVARVGQSKVGLGVG